MKNTDNNQRWQAGVGIFRDQSFTQEHIRRWLALNFKIAQYNFEMITQIYQVSGWLTKTSGVYFEYSEPSFNLSLTGDYRNVLGVVAEWGRRHHQREIIMIRSVDRGEGFSAEIRFREPLTLVQTQALADLLTYYRLGATLVFDDNDDTTGLIYWGQHPNDQKNVYLVRRYVEELVSGAVELVYQDGYEVSFINEANYKDYIFANIDGRPVRIDGLLQEYQSLS